MDIVEVTNEGGFDGLSSAWSPLLDAHDAGTIQSTFDWLRLWWDHYQANRELFILVAREGEQVVGIAPLMIETSSAVKGLASRRTIGFLGQGASDYGDFIVPARHDEIVAAFVGHLLKRRRRWDRIELKEIREDSPNLQAFLDAGTRQGLRCETTVTTACLQVAIDTTWDEYYGRVRAKFRSDIRRRFAKLEALGPVELVRHATTDDALWRELVQVNASHFATQQKQDLNKNLTFLRQVTDRLAALGRLDISLLKVGPQTIAYNIGLRHRGVVYHWKVGFHPEYRSFAPGRLLLKCLLEACFGDGTTCLDFMRGAEDYKRKWAFHERNNVNVTVHSKKLTTKVKSVLRRKLSSQDP